MFSQEQIVVTGSSENKYPEFLILNYAKKKQINWNSNDLSLL